MSGAGDWWIADHPPPTIPDGPATAGEQVSSYSIGDGVYRLYAASVHTSNAYVEPARIVVVNVDAAGAETEICLHSGDVSQYAPLCLPDDRLIAGPGYLRAYINNLAATAFQFRISIAKQRRGG